MGLLNSFPNVCVRGENNNAMLKVEQLFRKISLAEKKHSNGSEFSTHAWHGIGQIDREEFLVDIRESFVKRILKPRHTDIWVGYKEIRYGSEDGVKDLSQHLAFLTKIFPGVHFIFNARDVSDTASSAWWRRREDAEGYLTEFHGRMRVAYEKFQNRSLWIDYEALTMGNEIQRISNFLGIPADMEKIVRVMQTRHSTRTSG